MNTTKEKIEKLQHSTCGSLVAGIIAGSDGVKVPAKTDHILIENWKAMSEAERLAALAGPFGKSQFNYYDSDCITYTRWGWSPITGCLRDCPWCFARPHALRWFKPKFEPAFYPRRLQCPQHTKVPAKAATDISHKNVFACSMADLFGPWVPDDLIEMVLAAAAQAPQWNFLFLTKYPRRLMGFEFPDNAWVGATVNTHGQIKETEEVFQHVKARVKWLSCEPLLERLTFTHLDRFQWLVVGGTIPSTRKADAFTPPPEWVLHLRTQAQDAGCKVYEENLNGSEFCREFPVTAIAPVRKSKPSQIVEYPVDAIPLTDLALKKSEPIPSTSMTIDHELVEEAARRAAVATLQRQHLLADWAEPILAYKLGRYFIEDRCQPAVSWVLVKGLQAIVTLFEVDGNLTHGRFANLFDPFGWRTTSLNEIRELRKNLPGCSRPFSQTESRYILQDLNFIGFIEIKKGFDAKSESEELIIRFRPDRILQTINALTVLRQAELGQMEGAGAATGKMAPGKTQPVGDNQQ